MSDNSQNNKHDATHATETLADEAGVKEVPGAAPTTKASSEKLSGSSSSIKYLVIAALAVVAIALAVGLGVGLTRDNDDDDNEPTIATWIPYGDSIAKDVSDDQVPSNLDFWTFDLDGDNLVVATLSDDHTPQLEWYEWQNDNLAWQHQVTLPLGDAHPQSHPAVHIKGMTVVVSDAQSIATPDPTTAPTTAYQGLVRVYRLQGTGVDQQHPQFVLQTEASHKDLWGTAVALDDTGDTLVVGAPLVDHDQGFQVGSVQAFALQGDGGMLYPWGGPVYGTQPFASLGGAGLALAGDGLTLAAGVTLEGTAAGAVFLWTWQDKNWQNTTKIEGSPGQGLGRAVYLNDDGTLLAATTLLTKQVFVYESICDADAECTWKTKGQALDGKSVDLYGDDRLAVVHENTVRIYQYNAKTTSWEMVGDTLPGTAVRWVNEHSMVVQHDKWDLLQKWHWVE